MARAPFEIEIRHGFHQLMRRSPHPGIYLATHAPVQHDGRRGYFCLCFVAGDGGADPLTVRVHVTRIEATARKIE